MLAMTVSACRRASRISAMWPSCRLPMVGTKATRPASRRAARQAAMVSRICMVGSGRMAGDGAGDSVTVRGGGEGALAHLAHEAGDGVLDAGGAFHVVLDEAR